MVLSDVRVPGPGGGVLTVRWDAQTGGVPVLVHHGTPSCRYLDPRHVTRAAAAGVRLVSWDRPGYAGSPAQPGRTIADGAAEAATVADHLGLDRFTTWGFSGGGGYALACAALLPDRVSAAVVIASLAPYTALGQAWAAHFSPATQAEVALFFTDRAAARAKFYTDAAAMGSDLSRPQAWMDRWGEAAGSDDAHSR